MNEGSGTWRRALGRRGLAAALVGVLVPAGCGFGDCWAAVAVTVTVSGDIDLAVGEPVAQVAVARIYADDVRGVDDAGLPVVKDSDALRAQQTSNEPIAPRTFAFELEAAPYPTWHVAFVDRNDNGQLDPGEPYGVSPDNPHDRGCDAYTVAIAVDRVLPDPEAPTP